MNRLTYSASLVIAISIAWPAVRSGPAAAQQFAPVGSPHSLPFTATLSNTTPLAFGMDVEDTSRALGTPLNYVSGPPGDEIYLAFRNLAASRSFVHYHPLYLQFCKCRLTGWKGDCGQNC